MRKQIIEGRAGRGGKREDSAAVKGNRIRGEEDGSPENVVAADESSHNHEEDKAEDQADSWESDKHGGMSRQELQDYALLLDKQIRMLDIESVYDTVQNGTHLLFFGAYFCPHTQQFTAIWLNMQYKYDFYHLDEVKDLSIAKVQCADNQPLCFHYMRDEAFPTVVLFHNGHFIEELINRDFVWEYVEKQVEVVRNNQQSVEYAAQIASPGSLVVLPAVDAVQEVVSHEELEVESIGGAKGIIETVLPVSVFTVLIAFVLVAAFLVRRRSLDKGKYVPVAN
ncbi:hypothetical protein HK100_002906 [Physocladia obscura]|uniref:Thioredoxin domain-containing protein n=1 Tax=Physocladia obscura TaxID=109957 RepID=A0AAD5SWA1_9FUNG|nr:hypothetical protein HK100_002906 [Physocladia obscura]